MQKVEIIFDESLTKEFLLILKQSSIPNYTLLESIKGVGNSGARFGSAAAPGKNNMLIAIVEKEQAEILLHAIRRFKENNPKSGVKGMLFEVQEVI